MAELTTAQIRQLAKSIVAANPGGIRYSALLNAILQQHPETPRNRVIGQVWNIDKTCPNEIAKPSRGLFAPVRDSGLEETAVPVSEVVGGLKESDFYQPFSDYLKNDLGEVTEVVVLGGASQRAKWATPDVIGVYKPLASDLIKFEKEIVSAEIKIDSSQSVVAFGQAVAYRLFSTKTYIAMPTSITEDDKERLESLCMLLGVGLVLFNLDKNEPGFEIRVRAQRFVPDMFYVNEFARRLSSSNKKTFDDLFG